MTAVLGAYASTLLLAHATHQGAQLMVLAVVLTLSLERTQRGLDHRHRLRSLVVLPVVAVAATGVGTLLLHHATVGDALFVAAIGLSIWLRRFGPAAARAGTLIALPFIALLTTPIVAAPGGHDPALWAALVAVIAFAWVSVVHGLTGTVPSRRVSAGPAPSTAPAPTARRLPASTKMAVQMVLSLALAFAAGRLLFPDHWSWVVLTAFIVASGNRGRADVLHKSGMRLVGALAGTVVATLVAGRIAPQQPVTVVIIFAVLAVATTLRPLNYAYWAAGITAVLALLYGYLGSSGTDLLAQRLEGMVLGAAISVAIAWIVLPVHTTDVLRRRAANALAALSDVLANRDIKAASHRFAAGAAALEQIAPPLRLQRRLRGASHRADAIDALASCVGPIETLAAALPERLAHPHTRRTLGHLARDVGAIRMRIGGKDADVAEHAPPAAGDAVDDALAELDAALTRLAVVPLGPRPQRQK